MGGNVKLGRIFGHGLGDAAGKIFGLLPLQVGGDRHADVQALAARRFDEALEPCLIEQLTQRAGAGNHGFVADGRIWIEVEDQNVRVLEVIGARAPRVNLEGAELHQAEEADVVVDHAVRCFAFFFADRH